jgi:peptidoglycan/LPS O-acetylase OafA/YrhL
MVGNKANEVEVCPPPGGILAVHILPTVMPAALPRTIRSEEAASKRLPELDGLRGLACLLVLFWHYGWEVTSRLPAEYAFLQIPIKMWWTGVDLFFVLSGFLIGGILWDNRNATNYYSTFYIRRCCRIFPLYFGWLALGAVAGWFFSQNEMVFGSIPAWSYVFFLANIVHGITRTWGGGPWMGPAWSLALEEQFYLVLPFLVRAVPRKRLVGVLIILIASAVLFRLFILIYRPWDWAIPHFSLPARMDSLLLGVVGAIAIRNKRIVSILRNNIFCLRGLLLVGGAGIAMFSHRWQYLESPTMIGIGYTWLAVFYLSLLLLGLYDPLFGAVLRTRLLLFYGSISYGVYLMHPIVFKVVERILSSELSGTTLLCVVAILSIIATTMMAWLSFHLFEKRFLRLGHRWKYVFQS